MLKPETGDVLLFYNDKKWGNLDGVSATSSAVPLNESWLFGFLSGVLYLDSLDSLEISRFCTLEISRHCTVKVDE